MSIFKTEWNVVYNVGVKCNALDITTSAGVRYFSSPWDNMDSTRGLVKTAKLMANGFDKYMDDISDWMEKPARKHKMGRKNPNVQRKDYHLQRPDLYYPHVDYEWVSNHVTRKEYNSWYGYEKSFDIIWEGFSDTFKRRQNRMTSILKSENKVLLLRIDDDHPTTHRIICKYNTTKHINEFMEIMTNAFPKKDWGFLYLYDDESRDLSCDYDNCHLECIPSGKSGYRENWIVDKLKELNVQPRDEMKLYNFKENVRK